MQAITVLSLFTNNIENGVYQFSAFGIMTFRPIVTGTGLSEDKVIGTEDLAVGARSDAVHGSRFKIHKHSSRNVPSSRGLVVIDIDPLELDVRVSKTVVLSGWIYAVLVTYNLPEFGTDLVAALASLNVQDLSHGSDEGREEERNLGFGVLFDNGREREPNAVLCVQESAVIYGIGERGERDIRRLRW